MKPIISSNEIIGSFNIDNDEFEVCATADAFYDDALHELTVRLDSYLLPVSIHTTEEHRPDWLPKKQTVKESVSHSEAIDVARDIFHRWVRTVRNAVPLLLHV